MTNTATPATNAHRYIAPDGFTRRIFNPIVAGLARLGVGIRGARVLEVAGRTTGEIRTVPVNPLPLDGRRYLVSPRGHTQWSRNLRAAGGGGLRKGRKLEAFTASELADADKAPVIRAYLEIWAFEVGKFFDGITKDSTDAELAEVAAGFPVFEIHAV
jgi:deazaflavin-dependent oxidoreductase (nitroreductase family)